MNEKHREAANWALTMFLLASLYALAQRVAVLEERTDYLHGKPTKDEVSAEKKK